MNSIFFHVTKLLTVQFSRSVVSDSLRPHETQHARPPCPSPTPRVHPNSCPLSQWYHPATSSSVISFISCPQSLPASESFPIESALCNPMDCSMPGLPVHHQLLKFIQTHVHWISDAIQPSHPLSSPPPPGPNPSQHQSLFQWVNSSHEVAKVLGVAASTSVLPMNIQDWSPLGWTGWISLQSKGLSRVFSNTTVQKHQFLIPQLSL